MCHATGLTGWQRAASAEPAPTPPPANVSEVTEEQELEMLKAQANEAATTLDQIRQRIDEIAAAKSRDSTTE
jgi:hypothetical protein